MGYFNTKIKSEEIIKIGKPLLLDVSDPLLGGIYKSSVFDIDFSKSILKIGMPSMSGSFKPLPAGTRVYVKLLDRSSMFVFQSVVLSYEKDQEGFYVMFISLPESVRKIQRRRFVRVPFFKEGDMIRVLDGKESKFITKDLSAGGLLIATIIKLNLSEDLNIWLKISPEIILQAQLSKIVRIDQQTPTKHYIYGLKFISLPRMYEDALVRYVFKLEQDKRKISESEEI